jgi:hypothetical protein
MDLSDSIIPRSDQMNAEDLLVGPRTFTIREVRKASSAEQPVDVILAEFPVGRPFKPSKTVRRILVAAWGPDAATYTGRRMTLYRDPDVKFGGMDVGGIRVSHLSHIEKPFTVALTVTRGRRAPYRVQPLPDDVPAVPSVSAETLAELRALFVRKGIRDEARQLAGVNKVIGGAATDVEVITEDAARRVIAALQQRPDVQDAAAQARARKVGQETPSAPSSGQQVGGDLPDPYDGQDPWTSKEGGQ